jgi:hypothetical protein
MVLLLRTVKNTSAVGRSTANDLRLMAKDVVGVTICRTDLEVITITGENFDHMTST